MTRDFLDPAGTARSRLAEAPGVASALIEGAQRLDLDETHVFLAWELSRMAALESPADRAALTHLLLASIASNARGSTRLPSGGAGRDVLDRLLSELGVAERGRASVHTLVDRLRSELQDNAATDPAVRNEPSAANALNGLLGTPGAFRPLILDGDCLYHQKMWELEQRVAVRLATLLGASDVRTGPELDRIVADVQANPPRSARGTMRLSSEQAHAVRAALSGALTIVSGGPGTGKTSIVVSLLRALARLPDLPLSAVALAAPTGKAADRMQRSIESALRHLRQPTFYDGAVLTRCPPARTLHRLLGYSPRSGRYRHHERNPLRELFVIVDESSMIDLGLMDRLLRALRHDAQIVFLGDAHQLPSIEAGAVFRDLCASGGNRAAKLGKSFRMDPSDPGGRNILTIAERINDGDAKGLFEPHGRSRGGRTETIQRRRSPDEIAFEKVESIERTGGRALEAVLARFLEVQRAALGDIEMLDSKSFDVEDGTLPPDATRELDRFFDAFERYRILCVTRLRMTGVIAVNAWFHTRAVERALGDGIRGLAAPELVAGEPVMVQHNDYDRGLFNGDQGLTAWMRTERGRKLVAVFRHDDGFSAYPIEAIRPILTLAWAITVHKAQGSEYDHVALVLPETDTPVLTRELLYTGVTRARRSVLLVGTEAMLARGVTRSLDRSSGLAERIARIRESTAGA